MFELSDLVKNTENGIISNEKVQILKKCPFLGLLIAL